MQTSRSGGASISKLSPYTACSRGSARSRAPLDGLIDPINLDDALEALRGALNDHHNPLIWQSALKQRLDALELGQW